MGGVGEEEVRDAGPRAQLGVSEERREKLCPAPHITQLRFTRNIAAINHVKKNWSRPVNQPQLVGPVMVVAAVGTVKVCLPAVVNFLPCN